MRAIRAYIEVESDSPLLIHSGKLVKTIVYSVVRELALFHGLKGVVSPIHVSPLFTPGKREGELGELVTPIYVRDNGVERVNPVNLSGTYMFHVGGDDSLVSLVEERLQRLRTPLQLKFYDGIIVVRLLKVVDVTPRINEKAVSSGKVTVYLKAPVKLYNIFSKSKLPKFSVSAIEVLMTPFLIASGAPTITEHVVLRAMRVLGLLTETYYSISTVRTLMVPYNGRKTPAMVGKITYIVDRRVEDEATVILRYAEAVGVGQSRMNGFGTITWA